MGFKNTDIKPDKQAVRPEEKTVEQKINPEPKEPSILIKMGWIVKDDIREVFGKHRLHPYGEEREKMEALKRFGEIAEIKKR